MESVDAEAVRGELAAISATLGKAEGSRRLLTYLVDCHLRGKVPKETDVALDIFHRDASFDGAQDAVVRVAVRALRQKLDEFYRAAGRDRPLRLEIPRGAYRLSVIQVASPSNTPSPPPAVAARPDRRGLLIALTLLLAVSVVVNLWFWRRPGDAPTPITAVVAAQASPIWQPLLRSERPLTLVLGDLLLFPNPASDPGRIQLLRDARINTAEQLRAYLAARGEPASSDPGAQVATTLVPMSVAYGLVDLLPVVAGSSARPVEVRILDELRVDDLRTHDILFIGPLVRIGPLGEALFRGSRYAFNYDQEPRLLRDTQSGQAFTPSPGRRENANDYGLFASFRGPAGNRIMVFASVGSDLGLLPLMRRATSQSGLEELQTRLTNGGKTPLPDEFEALVSVNGYYRTDLSAELLEAHARPAPAAAAQASVSARDRNAP